ncbi:MAG: deoxyribodipyrimidine photo-lyase [Saprospiraceae bacterium]|nr:deoxyribodipyrimidine photo-lyase [Saprospiraceae bacterium]
MSASDPVTIFWFRRDLRLEDNAGLFHALQAERPVLCLFIFDAVILDALEDRDDARVSFLYDRMHHLDSALKEKGGGLLVRYGKPKEVFRELFDNRDVREVHTNRDYEPYARDRDEEIAALCSDADIPFKLWKDQVIFEQDEVLKDDGDPYIVYTPYMRKWKETMTDSDLESFETQAHLDKVVDPQEDIPSLEDLGFERSDIEVPDYDLSASLVKNYADDRDTPAKEGTTRLSVHLRFGTVSIRQLVSKLKAESEALLDELIWREFFMQILYHFPRVVEHNFREKYDALEWRNNEDEFEAWCEGRTGYPIVDAGMRELAATGYMHNRVRMIVASFLCKHLLIDWRWGEAWFARKLLDYELSSNNGNWQWAAGTGCDAAPYFRIFNPWTQQKKFDPDKKYIRQWLEELDSDEYPEPIVEHKKGRERALEVYGRV